MIIKLDLTLSVKNNMNLHDPRLLKEEVCRRLRGFKVNDGNLTMSIEDVGVEGTGEAATLYPTDEPGGVVG